MLALNASIEAARAGDAGRGFGVVSTKIDANSFADSMMQINSKISILYQEINSIAEAIDNVSLTINQSAEGVNLIAEKSGSTVAKTAEGYNLVRESKESVAMLKEIIDKFQM